MRPFEVVIALTNAMIGGLILILPVLTIQGGTLMTLIIILLTAFFSYYSCYLCVIHLGNYEDLDKAFYHHFNQSRFVKIAYDCMVFVAILFGLLFYFSLIVQQWAGLLGYNIAIPISNIFALFILVIILNYFHLGPKLMGYGLLSIIAYCIFLVWLIISDSPANAQIPLFGSGAVSMASAMGQAFTIQAIFIPILRELPDTQNYAKYTLYTYILGTITYIYIAYMGAFGVINRTIVTTPVQTIQDYFQPGQPQVSAIQAIYLVHLYSAFGQFLLISKKRFFGMCNVRISQQGSMLKIHQTIYVFAMIGICCAIYMTNVTLEDIITINGGIIGFFFIYLMPALMHLKCLYFCQSKQQQIPKRVQMEALEISSTSQRHSDISQLQKYLNQSKKDQNKQQTPTEKEVQEDKSTNLICSCKKPRPFLQAIDIISMVGMVGLGAFIMVDGIITVINGTA